MLINLDNEAAGVLDMVGRIFGVVRDEREAVGVFLDRMLQHSRAIEGSLRERANAAEDRIKRRADEDLADSRQLFRQAISNQTDLQRLITEFLGNFTDGETETGEQGDDPDRRREDRDERERLETEARQARIHAIKQVEEVEAEQRAAMNGHAARLTGTEG